MNFGERSTATTILGLPVGDGFRSRLKEHKESIRYSTSEESAYTYKFRQGDYGGSRLIIGENEFSRSPAWQKPARCEPESLMGIELFFERRIMELLELKKGAGPVLALDIGGMTGQTWVRLAKRFEDKVRTGSVVFAVSNLFYQSDRDFDEEMPLVLPKMRRFMESGQGLVHFLTGTVSQLRRMNVMLPDGSQLPLVENVDLMHECYSLSHWSWVPELEIVQAASLLSPRGTYPVRHSDTRALVEIGRDEIQRRFGLKLVERVECGELVGEALYNYKIFRKPGAAPVTVNK